MLDTATAPFAVFLLRLCLAALFLSHALLKFRVFTIPGTVGYFRR